MRFNILYFLLFLTSNFVKAQYLDSIRVLNSTNITSIDTVRIKVYGYLPDTSWFLTSESSSTSSNSIDIVVNFCSNTSGISVIINYIGNKKINPLQPGLYNLKVKMIGHSLANSVPCSSVVTMDSLITSFQVKEPNFVFENSAVSDLEVYPCPVGDVLNLHFSSSSYKPEIVTMYDILGKKVIEVKSPMNNEAIDVSNLKMGIYFLHVLTLHQRRIYKIIKY